MNFSNFVLNYNRFQSQGWDLSPLVIYFDQGCHKRQCYYAYMLHFYVSFSHFKLCSLDLWNRGLWFDYLIRQLCHPMTLQEHPCCTSGHEFEVKNLNFSNSMINLGAIDESLSGFTNDSIFLGETTTATNLATSDKDAWPAMSCLCCFLWSRYHSYN